MGGKNSRNAHPNHQQQQEIEDLLVVAGGARRDGDQAAAAEAYRECARTLEETPAATEATLAQAEALRYAAKIMDDPSAAGPVERGARCHIGPMGRARPLLQGRADRLRAGGDKFLANGKHAAALVIYRLCLDLVEGGRQNEDDLFRAVTLLKIGDIHCGAGNDAEAGIEAYDAALAAVEHMDGRMARLCRASALSSKGKALVALSRCREAMVSLDAALKECRECCLRKMATETFRTIGIAQASLGCPGPAVRALVDGVSPETIVEASAAMGVARLLYNLGRELQRSAVEHGDEDDLEDAVLAFETVVDIYDRFQDGRDYPRVVWSIYHLGGLHRFYGCLDEAVAFYQEALAINERLDSGPCGAFSPLQVAILTDLGATLRGLGRHDEVVARCTEAVDACELVFGTRLCSQAALLLLEIANAHRQAGRFKEAAAAAGQSYQVSLESRGTRLHGDVARALLAAADVARAEGDSQAAAAIYGECSDLCAQIGLSDAAVMECARHATKASRALVGGQTGGDLAGASEGEVVVSDDVVPEADAASPTGKQKQQQQRDNDVARNDGRVVRGGSRRRGV